MSQAWDAWATAGFLAAVKSHLKDFSPQARRPGSDVGRGWEDPKEMEKSAAQLVKCWLNTG